MKKQLSALLALSVLSGIITSCGEAAIPEDSVDTGNGETVTEVETTKAAINPELPESDFDGYEFKLLKSNEVGSTRYSDEIYAETENGEPLNDAVYKRNRMVEEKFDVKITAIEEDRGNVANLFKNSIMASDDSYDVLVDQCDTILKMANGYGATVDDLKYVDIDKEWWDGRVIREAAVGGKQFGLTGDINIVDDRNTWAMLFNKRLASEYNIGNLYDIVREGKWTMDEMGKSCKNVSYDLNGDSVMDYRDQWGMVASGNFAASFIWSCGGGFSRSDSKGGLELTIDSEKNINALLKAYEFYSNSEMIIDITKIPAGADGMTNWDVQRSIFREGRALFMGGVVSYVEYFRDMEDEFGVLPLPKYDENQSDYICTEQEWCATMFLAPRSAQNIERTGIILEAMASASVSTITPAFYDTVLKRKASRDSESVEMLDIIFASRVFDPVYAFNWGSIRNLSKTLIAESNTIMSSVASTKPGVETAYESFLSELEQ